MTFLMQKTRYAELDALRGIAAILVVVFHFTIENKESQAGFKLGVTGVDLFFMISGFVIFMSANKLTTAREFVINRFSRLYPTYWTCVTFTFILVILAEYIGTGKTIGLYTLWQYATNMTMFQQYLNMPDLDGSYWTMIVEMVFYLVILLLLWTKQLKNDNGWGMVGLAFVFLYDSVLASYFPAVYLMVSHWIPLVNHFPLFFAGILFYKIATEKTNHIQYYLLISACGFMQTRLFEDGGQSRLFVSQTEYMGMLVFYFLLFVLFVNGKLKFIVNRVTLHLGTISYALYLVHQYLGVHILIPQLMEAGNISFALAVLIAVAVCIMVASIVTFYIEAPLRTRLKFLLSAKSTTSHANV